ncbi:MAG: hypothetical protein WBA54_06155 [Acidaminobacteraceae bacterium]
MNLNLRESIFISLLVSMLLGGGYVLYIASTYLPMPGMKYVILAPYLSLIICALRVLVTNKWAVIRFNIVFAMIMSLISIYMSLAIIITTILTELTGLVLGQFASKFKNLITSALYSFYAVFVSLITLKYILLTSDIIEISIIMIISLSLVGFVLGIFGARIGEEVGERVRKIVVSDESSL